MGNIRRIKKKMTQPIAMADTKIAFNNCKVYLSHPNPTVAKQAAEKFVGLMKFLNERASKVNIHDLYFQHFQILKKIEAGEDLFAIESSKEKLN